ncbi:hypothetical protein [Phytomonospora endophytica]|uniref:DUF1877 family protein n=1 Tax=Phytomonospora endophytica TaxID=714109 RepID=A0A841FI81_9ACTN|nr:hypothetical protein [Phytomonospora endophytica]MBB6037051.1 hypothetical protein [Phytomonospora endophytica]GIG69406.1 hypothetical protein Pen01_57010 [Phytomonospora endophytica]
MGYDVHGLLADWPATVEAARTSRGLDFFWAHEDVPPCFTERDFAGRFAFQAAQFAYERMRPLLSRPLLARTDAVIGAFYGDDSAADDLAEDAELPHSGAFYALRPARVAVIDTIGVAWDEIEAAIAPDCFTDAHVPDLERFAWVVGQQLAWLREAAREGLGVVAVVGQ